MNKKIRIITRTAVLIALLVALQYVTKPLGQIVTGSCVNMVLAVAALAGGVWCGIVVAIVSPFMAFLLGIGPALIQVVPAIALGNLSLVIILYFMHRKGPSALWYDGLTVVVAAVVKFAVLFVVVVKLVLPILALPEKQTAAMSLMFSYPQLITALIGGVLGIVIYRVLKKALKNIE